MWEEIGRGHSGSVLKVIVDEDLHPMGGGVHIPLYLWAFGLYIRALQTCLQSIFSIDDTFLKYKYEGSLLIACVVDSDNGTIPVTYAMTKVE